MKLTPREKKKIERKRKSQATLRKAEESLEPELHPIDRIRNSARQYSRETQLHSKYVLHPIQDRTTRDEEIRHVGSQISHMSILKKLWIGFWLGLVLIFAIWGLIASF